MKSLRFQLLLGLALGVSVVFAAAGFLLDAAIARTLAVEFDALLVAKARALSALAEQDEDGLNFESIQSPLASTARSPDDDLYQLWRPDRSILARAPALGDRDLIPAPDPRLTPAIAKTTLPDGRPGRLAVLTFLPRQEFEDHRSRPALPITIVVARDTTALDASLAGIRRVLFGVGAASVFLSVAVLAFVVNRALRPVERLSRQIEAVGADRLATRIDAAGVPRELAPVVTRLNDLLARLDDAFQRERRFTGDVAHELRTPLAGLLATLELALARQRDPSEYRQAIANALAIDLQMQRMVENLLHLARADAGQLELRHEPVELDALVRDCWSALGEKAALRRLVADLRTDHAAVVLSDRDNLRLVIRNLLDNAVAHADENSPISVSTVVLNGSVTLIIANRCLAFAPDQLDRAFERFWRGGHHAADPADPHAGLGLPLCKAIIEQLGGSITAAHNNGNFTISVRLNAAQPPARDN